MIKLLTDDSFLEKLSYENIYEGKIKTIYRAYGLDNKFSTFLTQNGSLLMSKLDRDFVVYEYTENSDIEELAAYLNYQGAASVFGSKELLKRLEPHIEGEYRYNCIMEYSGKHVAAEIDSSPNLTQVFNILKEYFYIEYSSWLTDASHRVRHGISRIFLYKSASTVTALYDADNHVFLTQLSTKESERGKGYAKAMIEEVAGRYYMEGKNVKLVCREVMKDFYTKVGFKQIGECAQVYILKNIL